MIAPIVNIVAKFNPQARLFFAVVLGMGFAIDGAYTILLNLYLLRLDYGTEFIGLVNAAGLLSFALVSLPAGILGSQMSVTRLMKLGGLMVLIGAICLPLVELLPLAWRGSWLVFHYALMLAGFAFFFVNGAPFLMNTVDSQHKIHAFALKSAHLALAAFAGSLVGGMMPEWIVGMGELTLDDPAPYRLTMHVVALVLGASFVLLQFIRPLENPIQKLPQPSAEPSATTDGSRWTASFIALIGVMTFIRLFQVAGTATTFVYFNVYMDTQLGVSAGVIGGIAAIGRLIAVPYGVVCADSGAPLGQCQHYHLGIAGDCALPAAACAGGTLAGGCHRLYRHLFSGIHPEHRLRRLHPRSGTQSPAIGYGRHRRNGGRLQLCHHGAWRRHYSVALQFSRSFPAWRCLIIHGHVHLLVALPQGQAQAPAGARLAGRPGFRS